MKLRCGKALCLLLVVAAIPATAEPVRVVDHRVFVPVTVNGVAAEALLDSGAEMTLLDSAFAARLGLVTEGAEMARGTGGEEQVGFATGVAIEAVGTRIEDATTAVLDLSDIADRLVGEPVQMVLGRELFDAGRFMLDIEAARLSRVDDAGVPDGVALALTDHAGIKQFPIRIEGVETLADFDLGNGNEMLVGHAFAVDHGLLGPDRLTGRRAGGGLGGEVVRDLVLLRSVSVAGVEFTGVAAAIDATGHATDANVGVALLRHFVLTIDFPRDTVWLQPRNGPVAH